MRRACFIMLKSLLLCFVLTLTVNLVNAQQIVLQDDSLLVAFDAGSGALIRMERKSTHWVIERRPDLGISFRMLVPLPDRKDNFVLGQKQHAGVEKLSDQKVRIRWSHMVSEHGGILPITLTAIVTLKAGALTFDAKLENNSLLSVETISYPYFGDLNAPAKNATMGVRTMWYDNLQYDEIYPHFNNEKGYWGVFHPMKTYGTNQSLFCLIQARHQGMYVVMHDPTQPYLLKYTFVQYPGVISSTNNLVPQSDEISNLPVHLEFRACHFIYAHPHSTVELAPVVLRCYDGDWHSGVDLYKQWRKTWFKPAPTPEWVQGVNSWQQLQINSPVEDYRVRYDSLITYGRECAENGVAAIQLVGWNHGGQDGGDPSLDTDPGLGSWQDLHDAIAKIQAMGVKIILFAKLNWADKTTEWDRKELYKYAATDPYGIPYEQGGYSYYTPPELAGINKHRRDVMDILSPGYQNIAVHEFQKTLKLGAAGWLWDEVLQHGPVYYSFSADHGYTPPGYIYSADMPLAKKLHAAANKVNPDFLFSGEGPQDWLMQYYPCSYFRIDNGSIAVERYIDPYAPLVVAVTGFDDREMLNLILMDRYIISYEPYYFKGHITDYPLTLAYGKKIDSLRRRYKAYLWDAEFRDVLGAKVTADGTVRYAVFVTKTGKRAVVVVNPASDRSITAKVILPDPGDLVVATPERPDAKPTSGIIQIPARSAAVVMER
jgi:hypothetical protein